MEKGKFRMFAINFLSKINCKHLQACHHINGSFERILNLVTWIVHQIT